MLFWGFVSIISASAVALRAKRQMNVSHFSGMFSAFNFRFGDSNFNIKKAKTLVF